MELTREIFLTFSLLVSRDSLLYIGFWYKDFDAYPISIGYSRKHEISASFITFSVFSFDFYLFYFLECNYSKTS